MKIAILGGGFAGLSTCWFLLHYTQGSAAIDVYDPTPVGKGVSALSSGMLNPYSGKYARKAWMADRCIKDTHRLLTEASRVMGRPLVLSKGILRPALTEEQIHHFQITSHHYTDTEWWDYDKCVATVSGLQLPKEGGGLFVKEGLTLDVPGYLQGLWQTCALLGTQWYHRLMTRDEELEPYDLILIALGASSKYFLPLKDLPVSVVKGQILELAWPENISPLPFSLNSEKYIIMGKDHRTCLVGSTYEHDFSSPDPDPEAAKKAILPQILTYFPALADAQVVGCRAGLRAGTPNRLPLVGKVSDKIYYFTGLGSKGLLYHAWVGKHVARAMLTKRDKHLPEKLFFKIPNGK